VPRALTTEFRKLGTVRSPWLLLALGPLIVVAGISGLVASGGNVHDPAMQDRAFAHVGLAAIFPLVFGILAVAGEYSRGTITDTLLSFPARRGVVTAKLAAYGGVGAAAGLVSAGVALVVTAAWWSAKGGTFHLSAGTWRTLGGGVAASAALAAIGVGVGALVRNLVAAVAAALAWVAVVEGIAGQLIGSGLARWLPFSASESLDRAGVTSASGLVPGGLLPQWGGGLVLLGYAALFAAAALLITLKRDVT
jgi:ABC-2 type transport system permease protein